MSARKRVLMPLPDIDFDPTEVCVSWAYLQAHGYDVVFATESGDRAHADAIMISGEGLDPWGFVPGLKKLVLFGRLLRARKDGREAYKAVQDDAAFLNPLRFAELSVGDFDGLLLAGGHAPGMRQYLESPVLQSFIADFFASDGPENGHKPVAAICHGVLMAARSKSKDTGLSVLHGRKTTALTWSQEKKAQGLSRFLRFWDPLYYRTYRESGDEPEGYWSVESEIRRGLNRDEDFVGVPRDAPHYGLKTRGIARDSPDDERPAWVVRDGNYVSARWPGDVHTFIREFSGLLKSAG
ncbi:MAG: putative intracellular protease/amidase [Myxococcota bacterium]|jgi:putative intracellular protease/amidase